LYKAALMSGKQPHLVLRLGQQTILLESQGLQKWRNYWS